MQRKSEPKNKPTSAVVAERERGEQFIKKKVELMIRYSFSSSTSYSLEVEVESSERRQRK